MCATRAVRWSPKAPRLRCCAGAHHVLNLLVPYLEQGQRMHLLSLVGAYTPQN